MNPTEKILVVDDEPLARENLRVFLEDIGYEVLEAGNGETGLRACGDERPDLVLLDISMPGKNGFEVCRELKTIPELREIPVIFLSGLMETRDKLEAFASGGVDYVGKPFRLEEVEARVRAHLEIRRQRRELEESHRDLESALRAAQMSNRKLIEVNERLRESEALKSHFIAHMRNEINDPLGSILGLAGEICDKTLPIEQIHDLAGLIRSEAFQLEFQLRNIFCAAELEAGEATLAITRVDVVSLLQDAAETFASRARVKDQKVVAETAEDASPFATDAGKLGIVLANLLANAIEFSPTGGRIDLRAFRKDEALVIQVEDQGAGLSEADRAQVFERFRQLETGHARPHKGQGLGLAVVKALVELLEGQVSVESQPGRGTKFTCLLPPQSELGVLDTSALDGNLFLFDEPHEL
ncbi:MAG TPA: hybrid sensor histidine kinase/response regulator [Holophaga sp.]|nr:hybrid sensor histidine kinase/response regulator [Holophaga sp.]